MSEAVRKWRIVADKYMADVWRPLERILID
jgi:hypothetical protein